MNEYATPQLSSDEVEKHVLGVILSFNEFYHQYANILCEELFYIPKHTRIFQAIREQVALNGASDVVTVMTWLMQHPSTLNPDTAYLADVVAYGGITATFAQNVNTLCELRIRRGFRELSLRLQQASVDMSIPIAEIQKQATRLLDMDTKNSKPRDKSLQQANEDLRKMIVQARSGERPANVFPTGFRLIDELFAFATTELEIIAAESGVGKSIMCINMAVNMAKHNIPCYYISLEMRSTHLAARILAPLAGVSASKMTKHATSLSTDELRAMEQAQNETNTLPILFDEDVVSSPLGVIRNIREKAKRGYKVFYIDYIQQLVQGLDESNTEKALGNFARDLKNLAMELDICIIAVSQLNRDRLSPRPNKNRIRGSGQIVEAANSILFIYRPTTNGLHFVPKIDDEENRAEIIVGKARDMGETSFYMGFDGRLTRFYDLDAQPNFNKPSSATYSNNPTPIVRDYGTQQQNDAEADDTPF